jgi:hypothetical protein
MHCRLQMRVGQPNTALAPIKKIILIIPKEKGFAFLFVWRRRGVFNDPTLTPTIGFIR